ncbi:MAG: class I SAM-dependent methyltransferase [Steroidobacteraceae bacterium]
MSLARELLSAASDPYRAAGRFAYHYARGKLAHDPAFEAILARGLLVRRARILDLGCGQGLLAALLVAAREVWNCGQWPDDWPPPSQSPKIRGIELVGRFVERADRALAHRAEFIAADMRDVAFGAADGIVMLDVLHYLEYADQCAILQRAHQALDGDGILLLRVGDAAEGVRFALGKWVDQVVLLASGRGMKALYCRPLTEWRDLLRSAGFESEIVPMSPGAPFANVLIIAKPR